MAAGKRTLGRRIAITAVAVAGGLVVLFAILALLVSSEAVTARVVAMVVPRVSTALGREVTLRRADLSIFPRTRVALEGLSIAGRGGEPPLVAAESLDVEVGLWTLLRSRGEQVDVRAITLVHPIVNLVRARDGTWSFEGLGAGRGAAPAEPSPPPPAGGGPAVAIREVRIEKAALHVIDRSAGQDDVGVALDQLDLRASGIGPGLPFQTRIAAALAGAVQNVHLDLSVSRLPAAIPARPEDWPAVQGTFRLGALALDRLRPLLPAALGAIVRGGKASIDAKVTTAGAVYRIDGGGELADLSLRGQPASGHFRAGASLPAGRLGAGKVEVTDLVVRGPGVDLGGHASADLSPLRAWFVVTGPLLDLDAVMGVLPQGDAAEPPAPRPGDGGLLPASTRAAVRAASARGTVAIGAVRAGRMQLSDVRGRATLQGGVLTLDPLDAAVLGGRVSVGGTRVDLGAREPSWKLAARLSGIDLALASKAFGGAAPLAGKVDGTLEIAGTGTVWEKIQKAATGVAALALADGALTTTDLGDRVLGAVSSGLRAVGRGGAAAKVGGAAGGRTAIRDLSGRFAVKDGFLSTRAPLAFDAPFGKVSLGGRIGLDGRLDLQGTAAVPRSALGGGAALPGTLTVPIALGGTLGAPTAQVRAGEAVAGAARGRAGEAAGQAREKGERAGRRAIGDVLKGIGGRR
jgi:AsmA protein